MDDLFTYHVMGWRRIPPNRVGGKLFPNRHRLTFLFSIRLHFFFLIFGLKGLLNFFLINKFMFIFNELNYIKRRK